MTDQHPLTDEIINEIMKMDNLYEEDLRFVADWQLEQVIEFISKEDTVYADYIKKAMRPQQQEDN